MLCVSGVKYEMCYTNNFHVLNSNLKASKSKSEVEYQTGLLLMQKLTSVSSHLH